MRKPDEIPSVTALTWRIKDLLEGEFSDITVSGEVSQPTVSRNGHLYFTLKDDQTQISCVAWRSTVQRTGMDLAHGQQVNVRGDVQVYAPAGRYQVIVKAVQQAGEGALQQAFERLKKKLEAEGLFENDRKRPLPAYPRIIGVVTSESGAAFQDIRSTLERRYPLAVIRLYHAAVQGVGAASEIARGIRWFSEVENRADVLIVGRGGGSLEDLWSFNEEVVARAISESTIPVVSAVGHETDFSISDFVADVRAATPTQAAVLVSHDIQDLRLALDETVRRNERIVRQRVESGRETIRRMVRTHALLAIRDRMQSGKDFIRRCEERMRSALFTRTHRYSDQVASARRTLPPALRIILMKAADRNKALKSSLMPTLQKSLMSKREVWQSLHHRMERANPTEPLERGFTRVLQDGKWVRKSVETRDDQPITIQWKDGEIIR